MSFDWQEYLDLARNMSGESSNPPSQEACLRCAISRAYYAAFNQTCTRMRTQEGNQGIPLDGGSHQIVIKQLEGSRDQERRQVGTTLSRLKRSRVQADYYADFEGTNDIHQMGKKARQVTAEAQGILDRLPTLHRS